VSREPAPRSLAEAAAKRTLDAERRVRGTLRQLDADGATVSFAAVAEHARVSRAFLYAHVELRAEVEALRSLHTAAPARLRVRQRASDTSVRTRLRAALEEAPARRDRRPPRGSRARARPRPRTGTRPPDRPAMSAWPGRRALPALHGVAGEFGTPTAPHTESDPMALLIQLLITSAPPRDATSTTRSRRPATTSTSTRS
jgi:hypothetical protein